ncbi:MAG: radical SAM protein, partial [Armatimonadetes bacterium]|nr:radical SAM protein [Armatimonadota bacterium]
MIANYFLNQREQRAKAVVMKSLPSKVEIEISGKCNMRCRHCLRSYSHYPRPEEFMPLDDFEAILKQLPYTVTLTLTGAGEPLLHPDFLEIVHRARQLLPHLNIVVYTNFTLIEKAVTAHELVRSGVSQIHVSLDAASADVYRQVRGADAWDHILEGIKKLLAARNQLGARRPLVGT